MRFTKPSCRDSHELGFGAQLVDRRTAYVTHAAAETADHLIQHVRHRTAIWNTSLDAFWDQLLWGKLAFLEIAVGAAVLHGRHAAHAAHHLETTALQEERLPRALLSAREHRPHHDARCASRE